MTGGGVVSGGSCWRSGSRTVERRADNFSCVRIFVVAVKRKAKTRGEGKIVSVCNPMVNGGCGDRGATTKKGNVLWAFLFVHNNVDIS